MANSAEYIEAFEPDSIDGTTSGVDFTVAIRVYNAADRLPGILEKLRAQANTQGIRWEVVVVDNNSSDDTAAVVQAFQNNWLPNCPLRYVLETKQGAAFARRRAMLEAKGAWVGFLDDDNLPDENWVAIAHTFGQNHPEAGAFGGQIHGIYEVPPPPNFAKIAYFLVLIERKQTFCYTAQKSGKPASKVLPPGAGIVIQKQAWLRDVPERLQIQGPQGNSIASKGEDMELLIHLCRAGWQIWNNADLHIYHQIPSWRLEREYLLKIARSVGLSKHPIRTLHYSKWQQPTITYLLLMSDLRQALIHFLRHRKVLKTDVVAACQMEVLMMNVIGPFYHWKKAFLKH